MVRHLLQENIHKLIRHFIILFTNVILNVYLRNCAIAEVKVELNDGAVFLRKHMPQKSSWFSWGSGSAEPEQTISEKQRIVSTLIFIPSGAERNVVQKRAPVPSIFFLSKEPCRALWVLSWGPDGAHHGP